MRQENLQNHLHCQILPSITINSFLQSIFNPFFNHFYISPAITIKSFFQLLLNHSFNPLFQMVKHVCRIRKPTATQYICAKRTSCVVFAIAEKGSPRNRGRIGSDRGQVIPWTDLHAIVRNGLYGTKATSTRNILQNGNTINLYFRPDHPTFFKTCSTRFRVHPPVDARQSPKFISRIYGGRQKSIPTTSHSVNGSNCRTHLPVEESRVDGTWRTLLIPIVRGAPAIASAHKIKSIACPAYPVERFGFWVSGFGFRVFGFGFRVSGFGCRVSGFVFRVSCFVFWV